MTPTAAIASTPIAAPPQARRSAPRADQGPLDVLDLREAASALRGLAGRPTPATWRRMAAAQEKGEAPAVADLKSLDEFAGAVRAEHKRLHEELRELPEGAQGPALKTLQKVHVFLHVFDELRQGRDGDKKQAELDAISVGGESPTVEAYYQFAGTSRANMAEVLDLLHGLQDGDSSISYGGNSVRPLVREEIWDTKMRLLDEALASAKKGSPTEIDCQYYELTSDDMIDRLVACAEAGCKVRVNVDPGRMAEVKKDDGKKALDASEVARKLHAAYKIMTGARGKDLGLSFYPVAKELGSTDSLMHRKVFRVGDTVMLGGMNANHQSGENVDAACLIQGPAAKRLVEIYARDLRTSMDVKLDDLFGKGVKSTLRDREMHLSPDGLNALLAMSGGKPADLLSLGRFSDVDKSGRIDGRDVEITMQKNGTIALRDRGVDTLRAAMDATLTRVNAPRNEEKLEDVTLPSAQKKGEWDVAIGDLPREREAILLHAISTAEKFIYMPDFVVTRAVAKAVAARRDELAAQGKKLDVRAIVDSGMYPHGGTPNEYGVVALEDAGIPVRWTLLHRTNEGHPRKLHAKVVLTDKMVMEGSTNLSRKGLTQNWEMSGIFEFRDDDPQSVMTRDTFVNDFLKTWDQESIEINTRTAAEKRVGENAAEGRDMRIDEARHRVVNGTLIAIHNYANESAKLFTQLAQMPTVQAAMATLPDTMAPGYRLLEGVDKAIGHEELQKQLHAQPSYQTLLDLR